MTQWPIDSGRDFDRTMHVGIAQVHTSGDRFEQRLKLSDSSPTFFCLTLELTLPTNHFDDESTFSLSGVLTNCDLAPFDGGVFAFDIAWTAIENGYQSLIRSANNVVAELEALTLL